MLVSVFHLGAGFSVPCLDKNCSYPAAKTPGSWCLKVMLDPTLFLVFSQLHSGVTGSFDLPLFVSTFIFISMKEAGCQLSVNINFVVGSSFSTSSAGGLICIECILLQSQAFGKNTCFSSVNKIMAVLQHPPPTFHCSCFILLTQDKSQTNVIQLSDSPSLGALSYLSGCSGLLSCQLTLTDSSNLAKGTTPSVVQMMLCHHLTS